MFSLTWPCLAITAIRLQSAEFPRAGYDMAIHLKAHRALVAILILFRRYGTIYRTV
jgi:hypothetical protein